MTSLQRERGLLSLVQGQDWYRLSDIAKKLRTSGHEVLALAKCLGVFLIQQGADGIYLKRRA